MHAIKCHLSNYSKNPIANLAEMHYLGKFFKKSKIKVLHY
jgi:hypothetical protein